MGKELGYAIIYMATNKINGKRYIGVTSFPLSHRKAGHANLAKSGVNNGHFHRSIRKNGIEVFDFVEIDRAPDLASGKLLEMDWIADLNPEYNSTKGGDGQNGRFMSAETRAKIGAASKGNKYRLGTSQSEATRAKLAEISSGKIHIFKQYQAMGPKASSRPVVCLDDGKTYESASEAARAYGVSKSALIELCLGKNYRQTVGKKRFAYVVDKAAS